MKVEFKGSFARDLRKIKYLPSYSPELNLIEILWRFMKYTWLPFSASPSFASLRRAVAQILKQFGTAYRIDFKTV